MWGFRVAALVGDYVAGLPLKNSRVTTSYHSAPAPPLTTTAARQTYPYSSIQGC